MSEDMDKRKPEAEIGHTEGDDDVEAHKVHEKVHEASATEEGPDVEAHKHHPKVKP